MAAPPLRFREIAALSWAAARSSDGNTKDTIENLQRAVSITRRWLAEVESEIASRTAFSGTNSEVYGGSSSEAFSDRNSTCAHIQPTSSRPKRYCRLLACFKAYRDTGSKARGSEDLKLLCKMYEDFSARVAEAQTEIVRLSTFSRGSTRRSSRHGCVVCAQSMATLEPAYQLLTSARTETSSTCSMCTRCSGVASSVSSSRGCGTSKGSSSKSASSPWRGGHVSPDSVRSRRHSTLGRVG